MEQKIFDVKIFGATGSGMNFDTLAVQKAMDACGQAGGGTVRFRPGTYLSRPLIIRSKTTIELMAGATLLASTNQSDFMKVPGDWLKARGGGDFFPFISGQNLTDVTFTGGGVVDGSGSVWWGEAEKARQVKSGYTLPRPNLIVIEHCKNLRMENITLQNSPKFHFVPTDCEGVVISNVTVLAPERAANTDAIDPSGCKNVLITRCLIDVGDDNIAIKAGKKITGREFACEDITVTDCTFRHGHGMSIGSETAGGVRNVTVRNCTFENTENGLRIKSQAGRGGIVEHVVYADITMNNVNPAVTLTCVYANNSASDINKPAMAEAAATLENMPLFRDILIRNVTATCTKEAGIINGLPASCITNVVFDNVHINASTGFVIRNASGVVFTNSSVTVKKGESFALENSQVEGLSGAKAK